MLRIFVIKRRCLDDDPRVGQRWIGDSLLVKALHFTCAPYVCRSLLASCIRRFCAAVDFLGDVPTEC